MQHIQGYSTFYSLPLSFFVFLQLMKYVNFNYIKLHSISFVNSYRLIK